MKTCGCQQQWKQLSKSIVMLMRCKAHTGGGSMNNSDSSVDFQALIRQSWHYFKIISRNFTLYKYINIRKIQACLNNLAYVENFQFIVIVYKNSGCVFAQPWRERHNKEFFSAIGW